MPGAARRLFLALALLALGVVLARPICDASHAKGAPFLEGGLAAAAHYSDGQAAHHDDSDPCCVSVDDASLVVGTTALVSDAKPPALPMAQASSAWRSTPRSLDPAIPPDQPPMSRPYHARSSRLLI